MARRRPSIRSAVLALLLASTGFSACTCNDELRSARVSMTTSPRDLDFGAVPTETSRRLTLNLVNDGTAALTSLTARIEGDVRGTYALGSVPASIAAGLSAQVVVTYTGAATAGKDDAVLVFGIGVGTVQVPLAGSTVAKLAIDPAAVTLRPGGTQTFSATGGTPPYTFELASGSGSLAGATYTAGTGAGTATVRVTDASSLTADAQVKVEEVATDPLQISPRTATVAAGGTQAFTASGGKPPYRFALVEGDGSVSGATYTAGAAAGNALVRVTDDAGATSDAAITITATVTVKANGLAAGGFDACALVHGGVQCWGMNFYGNLGDGTTYANVNYAPAPERVANSYRTGLTVTALSVAMGHSCAIANGEVYCWGHNASGELGDGTTTDSSVPVAVQGLSGTATAVVAGGAHSCAVAGGDVYCWGVNVAGQCGADPAKQSFPTAVLVPGAPSGATALSAGDDWTCALANGGVTCWGGNGGGQLGDGTTTDSHVPVAVSGLTNARLLTGAGKHNCVATNTDVKCWGGNATGQLGNGSSAHYSAVPVTVTGSTGNVTALAAGDGHTCDVQDGAVYCWGSNDHGQCGNGSAQPGTQQNPLGGSVRTPTKVVNADSGATLVSAAVESSCAVLHDAVRCWGDNSVGQLGDGTTTSSTVPAAPVSLRP